MSIPHEAVDAAATAIHRATCPLRDDPAHECPRATDADLSKLRAEAALKAAEPYILRWKPSRADEISERAEEVHAEHHAGYFVPTLDSCPEHDRADYEALAAGQLDASS